MSATGFLSTTPEEITARGWDAVDVVFVTGDAYIDHSSFAMAVLGRVLEADGFRVAILSQPDWRSCEPWKRFGRPRLFFAVSAGNMDSMINHYTANRKVRNDDAYSPGGRIGLRPDRATLPYCQRAREAFKGVPVIAGGVEASLRRLAHYDFWSDKVRPSILSDSKADLVCFGMGEETISEIARRLRDGKTPRECRDLRGVAYFLGAKEPPPEGNDWVELPSFEEVRDSKDRFLDAARLAHRETNPFNAKGLLQRHGTRVVVVTPPNLPVSTERMDYYYGLPYTRRAHPSYTEKIPAWEMIKDSVTIMRGCFGGCTFCSITAHQGRTIQSRSEAGVLRELDAMARDPEFKGVVSDIGGPTANMYRMRCTKPEIEAICKRQSCVHPTICKCLGTDHAPLVALMRRAREIDGIKKVFVASGIRMDLARLSPEYMRELTRHHVSGRLKVAPEHANPDVLNLMKKPRHDTFEDFAAKFASGSEQAGKSQFLVPYFIASHPGSDLNAMIDLAVFLKRSGYKPDQVQDFIPAPHDLATAMYYTGRDPHTGKEIPVAKGLKDRKLQRALLQFFKPENWFEVREALIRAKRRDLIGEGCDALIPSAPPPAATAARRDRAEREFHDHVHSSEMPPSERKGGGYRPKRKSARRRERG
ncbi:MAG: YgiQ family radical SAM protein [Elusimicrobia bacterium CG_4_9_14_3_um_filter_62_55]|nr:MAG: YgiQ family radical SAM protein [Elusimicrobia bacterium CG22_combo_CG10-13_8_21_14_all_63_91]PJA14214.1 MAG: YgiQ family radical SAM protein [Elusimicrobia bacterium CG_4_10_14_0_2_um_filter_63_34]PJB24593.1 MAG: YgiQ family radical SAM protein [Elusimicrobia bacterium CG_4_9_14_3_um_filter_62_55]